MNDLAIKFTCDCSNTNMRFLGYNKMTQVTKKSDLLIGQFFYSLKNLILVLLQSHVNLIVKPFIE